MEGGKMQDYRLLWFHFRACSVFIVSFLSHCVNLLSVSGIDLTLSNYTVYCMYPQDLSATVAKLTVNWNTTAHRSLFHTFSCIWDDIQEMGGRGFVLLNHQHAFI